MSKLINYEEALNPSQLEAVTSLNGPLLVIAGAGSGKTRTLVYRVARLIDNGMAPEGILLLTFTRKAAGEMLERAEQLTDDRCRHVSGGTFHSLAHQVLRNKAGLMGFERTFTILDRQDMEEIVQSIVQDADIEKKAIRFPKRATLATILSKAVNLEKPVEYLMREEFSQFLEYIKEITGIASLYREYKRKNQLMDYDDLLISFRQLLSENEDVRIELGERYRYIMVDEYQDTNGIQADIVRWLSSSHGNIMVVGDDSQSIYSFRGASYRNMFDFPRIFPGTKIIKLEQNYRSTQPILALTNAIMDQAVERYTKCLFTTRQGGQKPQIVDVKTDPEQALFISGRVMEFLKHGLSLKDMAVLFRAAHHSFELEMELSRQGIPFVKYGGFKFMESAHIKDVLGHLRVIVNRNDTLSWGRVLRLIQKIGPRKSQAIMDWMRKEQRMPWQIHEWPGAGKSDEALSALSGLMKGLSREDITPREAVELVNAYYDPILKENFDNFPKRQKDLEQIASMAGRYKKLRSFLDDLVLEPPTSNAEIGMETGDDCLTLSTVHSSKGLEWSVVFIIWVMEGSFPSAKSYASQADLEEERRLLYVAATRAKDRLIICYPGQEELPVWQLAETGYRNGLSSFIRALPEEVMEHASPRKRFSGTGFPLKGQNDSLFNGRANTTPSLFSKPIVTQDMDKDRGKKPQGLRPGDRVRHPAFGRGVISRFIDGTKVEVLFKDFGRKLLHLEHTILEKL
ncbi:MAG: UvrD-helicase domain-containing protein [Deltaproteobacteria bacterium]|nr:UvrD-helicase domain-containing protein [Deltaproteobacteria bacterium]